MADVGTQKVKTTQKKTNIQFAYRSLLLLSNHLKFITTNNFNLVHFN